MAPSKTLVSESTKSTLAALLTETATIPKPLTVEQLIVQQKTLLRKMLKNGHSPEVIAAVFVQQGINIPCEVVEIIHAKTGKKKGAKAKELTKEQAAHAATTITPSQSEQIIAEWQRLSAVRVGFTKQELVAGMTQEIDAALTAGYDYADIAQLLATKGVTIAVGSLRKYHQAAKSKTKQPSKIAHTPALSQTTTTDNALFEEDFADV